MQDLMQHLSNYFQQISASVPWIPVWGLIFLLIVAGFLALTIALLALRVLGSLLEAIFGFKRRRRARGADPAWEREMRLQALRQQHHWQREDYY
ncbi:MAG TPA: hypothetical protein VF458_09125 [Ktedonobacteraceae bacterium]